ncbi:MAG: hypothetical protein WCJ71_00560 [Candidatus Omnitrophota bacterium]
MRNLRRRVAAAFFVFVAGFFLSNPLASANVKEMKAYMQAFPTAKVKCISCHAVEKPTKNGSHGLNDYGDAVLKAEKNPTPEIFRKLGKAEDFKKK